MADNNNVSSPHNTIFWVDLASKYDAISRKLGKKEPELRAAHAQAETLLKAYFESEDGWCAPRCARVNKYSSIAFLMLYVLTAVFGLSFITVTIQMVTQKTYNELYLCLVFFLGVPTLCLILIPTIIYVRLRYRARRIVEKGNLPLNETLITLAQRLFSNPRATFSERVTQYLADTGKMLIVPRYAPNYERMIKSSTMVISFCLVYYSSIKKKLTPDDFREYLAAVMLLAILDLENAELINPAILVDATS